MFFALDKCFGTLLSEMAVNVFPFLAVTGKRVVFQLTQDVPLIIFVCMQELLLTPFLSSLIKYCLLPAVAVVPILLWREPLVVIEANNFFWRIIQVDAGDQTFSLNNENCISSAMVANPFTRQ